MSEEPQNVKDYHKTKGKKYIAWGMLIMLLGIGGCLGGLASSGMERANLGVIGFVVFGVGFTVTAIGRFHE